MGNKYVFRFHAVKRMAERKISETQVITVLSSGRVIEEYLQDQPYPSYLKLGHIGNRALHVVAADVTTENTTIIITVYEPDPTKWMPGLDTRRSNL